MPLEAALQSLSTREAVADALYRALEGLDHADEQLFRSAMTSDAKFTIQDNTTEGLDTIVADTFARISKLDTTHLATNIRVSIDGSKARMTATAMAQHYKAGTGMQDGPRLLAGGFYELDLVQLEGQDLWKIRNFKIKLSWSQGDWTVIRS